MIKGANRAITCSRWLLPLFSLGLGIVVFVVSWVGGQFGAGLGSLAILAAFGLLILLLTGRSETVRGLTVARDERFAQIDQRATAVAGLVVLVTLIVAWLVATARGQNGHPYDWLLATSGVSYLLAIAFFRWRG
jgi:Predicted membrane protein (DUF2178)